MESCDWPAVIAITDHTLPGHSQTRSPEQSQLRMSGKTAPAWQASRWFIAACKGQRL